jgi:2-keto-4-pentenoate hydratase/2-oxohepta-3-ene-1,7-dioic acid hydratase in catechol pathway
MASGIHEIEWILEDDMRFCTFSADSIVRFGCELDSERLVDFNAAGRQLLEAGELDPSTSELIDSADLKSWLSHGETAHDTAKAIRSVLAGRESGSEAGVYQRRETRVLAPLKNPGKIIAVGLNYLDHAKEQKEPLPERPLLFAKFPTAIIGPDEPVKIPPISQKVDPEAELCIVMLKGGRHFSKESAKSAAAFMVGNDVSARDLQFSDKQWVRGKSCDTFAPCGPFIVTMEDVGDPHNLKIELTVNDRVQQSSNTSNLIFDCWHLIEYISQAITLEVGDIIFTGTPSGVGVFRDPPVFVGPGDVLEVSIDKLGTLRNPVVAG